MTTINSILGLLLRLLAILALIRVDIWLWQN